MRKQQWVREREKSTLFLKIVLNYAAQQVIIWSLWQYQIMMTAIHVYKNPNQKCFRSNNNHITLSLASKLHHAKLNNAVISEQVWETRLPLVEVCNGRRGRKRFYVNQLQTDQQKRKSFTALKLIVYCLCKFQNTLVRSKIKIHEQSPISKHHQEKEKS